jgi:hypothetical protein
MAVSEFALLSQGLWHFIVVSGFFDSREESHLPTSRYDVYEAFERSVTFLRVLPFGKREPSFVSYKLCHVKDPETLVSIGRFPILNEVLPLKDGRNETSGDSDRRLSMCSAIIAVQCKHNLKGDSISRDAS